MICGGIDNGVTGSIAILNHEGVVLYHSATPVFETASYTKEKKNIHRIDTNALAAIFDTYVKGQPAIFLMERPMINPLRFDASISAARALEATLICLEKCKIPFEYIDSRKWQKEFLPQYPAPDPKLKGAELKAFKAKQKKALKKDAMDIAARLFPNTKVARVDLADSLIIAEYTRRHRCLTA